MLQALIEHGHKVQVMARPKGRLPLHCMALSAGLESRFNEAYSWDGLKRGAAPFLVVQHTLAGRGHLDFDGARHELLPGDTMVLSFPHANRYWLEKGDHWEYFWFVLNGREALRLARAIIDAGGPVLRLAPSGVDRMAQACLDLIEGDVPLPGTASAAAYAVMMALQDAVFDVEADSEPVLPPAIQRSKTFIDKNLSARLDIDRMARAAQLSRAHFVRQFAVAVGTPPSDYVFARRMERASRLLIATDNPVLAISEACGFADPNYFAKAFRRAYGLSPTAYRSAGVSSLPMRGEV